MTVGVIGHHKCNGHSMGDYHPESPKRLGAIQDQLIRSGLEYVIRQYDATPIDRDLISLAHDDKYIQYIFDNAPKKSDQDAIFRLDDDTSMNADTLPAALLSAGAAINAVDLVMDKTLTAAFCATRPPGHHAEYDKGMGFCFFNNIAIAAAYAKKKYKLERVAIVDFDVHHGNGTEDIIKRATANGKEQGYLFCSSYQYPFYPFEMQESDTPPIINTPLPATCKGPEFRAAISKHWLPALEKFKPQIIFISAGFDAHIEDEMSQISLTECDYRWVTDELKTIADKYSEGRIISMLEGGYALSALGRSVVEHMKGLISNQ
ncbi:histone deacetylase family protein [Colwellia sp. BRX8-2]|uniref:histone deacetylase family protein n=1 Tax=unclassified Colwellia TaxID=196834 RepID=UPI0015F37809|nr:MULTISPECIES: histone deacetylase family protein [unclassified Colwellia]MBA6361813.1 histone deacetylase family protein [Colwellia sp. BRX8-6]MBA6367810.1 histone deacetylase family protein [Colwellia sp. BRX8-5]MBA6374615.1 histone deacetylase family protein [Colwellia sp. BRX8-2]|tara:strand:- start:452 stop:1408 length:957 start_codon:yes stop_codon:yes gene_type:complete